jgi:histone H3/H4
MARTKQTVVRGSRVDHRSSSKSGRAPKKDAADAAGGIVKKRRKLPGTKALAEIRKQQKSTDELLLRAPFKRVVDDLLSGEAWQMCPRDETLTVDDDGVETRTPCNFSYSGTGVNVADQECKGYLTTPGAPGEEGEPDGEPLTKRCRSLDGHGALAPASAMGVRWSNDALRALRLGCEEMVVQTFRDANALVLSKYTESRAPVTVNVEDMDAAFTMRNDERYNQKMHTNAGNFGAAHVRQRRHAEKLAVQLAARREKRRALKEDVGEIARNLKFKQQQEEQEQAAADAAHKKKKEKRKKEKKLKAAAEAEAEAETQAPPEPAAAAADADSASDSE